MAETYGVLVDEAMRKWFEENPCPVPAYPMAEYHLGWRNHTLQRSNTSQGKMLRPVFCMLTYQVFNADISKVIPLAAAIELYHNHTLVFDDMQDGDRFRRNRPTVWSLWGIGQGINVGLILGYLSQHFLLLLQEKGFPAKKLFVLKDSMIESMLEVAQGQSMDLDFESDLKVESSRYLEMIEKKTGSLIGFSTYGGALLGQDDLTVAESFKRFGRKLGVAMQIRDDLIGIWGDKEQSGKEKALDLRRRKKTLPFFKSLELLKGENLELLSYHYEGSHEPDSKTVSRLVTVMESQGVREACEKEANRLWQDLFTPLHAANVPQAKLGTLEAFARYAFDSIGTLRQTATQAAL